MRPVILPCRESHRHSHKVARTEQALSRIAEHSCHILVLILAAKLLKDDVALHSLATLSLLTLYSESLALLYYSHDFCVHNNFNIKPLPRPLPRRERSDVFLWGMRGCWVVLLLFILGYCLKIVSSRFIPLPSLRGRGQGVGICVRLPSLLRKYS